MLGHVLLGDEDGPFLDEYDVLLADFERDEVRRVVDWVYAVLVSEGSGGGESGRRHFNGNNLVLKTDLRFCVKCLYQRQN